MKKEDFAFLRNQDLINNPTPRVAICLCLDVSGSMHGDAIRELNKGVSLFFDAIRRDETAMYASEIAIVTFGYSVECVRDFSSLTVDSDVPVLEAEGTTPMGEAVTLALDMLNRRKQDYKRSGVDYYQPWLVIMSDGEPNGNAALLKKAKQTTSKMVAERKLTLFPIGIGNDADMGELRGFNYPNKAYKLAGLKFREFFEWLSKSVSATSQSTPGETVVIDENGIPNWASKGWDQLR